jgi:prepilin-type N-terminal cleavage/methylation domain-containing protein
LAEKLLFLSDIPGSGIKMKLPGDRTYLGFTLVEIMIVVAVIALLAAICVPSFLRARKRTQATRVLEDLRLLDNAIDQYAAETGKAAGVHPVFSDLKTYVKANTRLYNTGRDLFNRRYGPFTVDNYPRVPTRTYNVLSDVADAAFWSPYD